MIDAAVQSVALKAALAGALAFAFGGAPLGVLLVSRRMSLVGDAMSHAILPGVALAWLAFGPNPWAVSLGALIAALAVVGLSTLAARIRALPEDATFAVVYLSAFALGVLMVGKADPEYVHGLLFGVAGGLQTDGLILAAAAASATLIGLAVFVRGFIGDGADAQFMRASGAPGWVLHLALMALVAVNLVAGFRAFGALMAVGLMMIPAVSARFWARDYLGQAGVAVLLSAAAGGAGLVIGAALGAEPGAVMILAAAALFVISAVFGRRSGLIQNLPGRAHLEG